MKTTLSNPSRLRWLCLAGWAFILASTARASDLDTVGVTLLRLADPTLNGTGVAVAQPEAGAPTWEANPAAVGRNPALFTYASEDGTTSAFPNTLGSESSHADDVGGRYYGIPNGVATNAAAIGNYEANYFFNTLIQGQTAIPEPIVNQSFIFGALPVDQQQLVDSLYDDYASTYGTLFVSGAGNGGVVSAPATAYNGIGVGASDATGTSHGPTPDNGRSKPDLTAPGGATSYSTPLVAGTAAVLCQAGLRGDGGADTTLASDARVIKALLLNGAIKPAGWTHTATAPLDATNGAGVLNAFNSYQQLAGGRHGYIDRSLVNVGGAHPPTANPGNMPVLVGWDFNMVSNNASIRDIVNHYYFNLSPATNRYTLTATVVWNRQTGATNINNLDLFLYNTANTNLIASSVSAVDNVEHLFVPSLPPGRYDLQVLKKGGAGVVSNFEHYALAYEMIAPSLSIAKSGANLVITWPAYPAGFVLQSSSALGPSASWSLVNAPSAFTNGLNQATLTAAGSSQFFRLVRP